MRDAEKRPPYIHVLTAGYWLVLGAMPPVQYHLLQCTYSRSAHESAGRQMQEQTGAIEARDWRRDRGLVLSRIVLNDCNITARFVGYVCVSGERAGGGD
jgi:hypothetical protein